MFDDYENLPLFPAVCRFPEKEISEISEISVTDNNSDRYTY